MDSINSIGNIEGVIDPTNQKERFFPTNQSFLANRPVSVVNGSHDQTTALSAHQRVPTNTPEHSCMIGETLKVNQRTIVPLVSKPIDEQFDNRYNSEWAQTVDEIMQFVHKTVNKTSTYYKYLHRACDRSTFALKNPALPINECELCPKGTALGDKPSSQRGSYNPNKSINFEQWVDIKKTLTEKRNIVKNIVEKKANTNNTTVFQFADSITISQDSGHGNCYEMAMLFAIHYLSKYPQHIIEVLGLEAPGDHTFIRVSHLDISTMIIDPWAFNYFVEKEQDKFLTNEKNSKIKVKITNEMLIRIINSLPENLPEEYQSTQKSLNKIQELENKYTYAVKKLKKIFPHRIKKCHLSNPDDNNSPMSGKFKVLAVYTEKDHNKYDTLVLTEFGLHKIT